MVDHLHEQRLTTILNALTDFVWLRQPSGRMDFMNEAAEAALRVTKREATKDATAYLRHIVPEDRDRVISAGREAVNRAVKVDFRLRLPGAETRKLRARVFPLHGQGGETIAVMGIAHDLSREGLPDRLRKKLTRAKDERDRAKSREGEMRAMLDRITDGFFALDREWRVLYVNRRFEELAKAEAATEAVGKSIFSAFPGFRGTVFHAQYERALRDNVTVEFEAIWEPTRAWYEVHAYPSAEGLSVFFQDVTERRRLELELVDATARERQRVGAELHDSLGQRLTGTSLLIQAMEARVAAGDAVDPAELRRIGRLVGDLVAQTRRISRGLFPVELDGQTLAAALENLGRDVEELFGTSCRTEVSEAIRFSPETEVHLLRFAQELITNAVKHGGATSVQVNLAGTRGGVELCIEHDGTGPAVDRSEAYGLGLRSLEYRARAIGAVVETDEVAGGGTRTTCRIPS